MHDMPLQFILCVTGDLLYATFWCMLSPEQSLQAVQSAGNL